MLFNFRYTSLIACNFVYYRQTESFISDQCSGVKSMDKGNFIERSEAENFFLLVWLFFTYPRQFPGTAHYKCKSLLRTIDCCISDIFCHFINALIKYSIILQQNANAADIYCMMPKAHLKNGVDFFSR